MKLYLAVYLNSAGDVYRHFILAHTIGAVVSEVYRLNPPATKPLVRLSHPGEYERWMSK